MKKPTIALCMIVKNEEANMSRVLNSAIPYVDKVYITDTGSTDKTKEIVSDICKINKKPYEIRLFEWVNDFAKARNYSMADIEEDYILWLDADDTIQGGEYLERIVFNMNLKKITGCYNLYQYQTDENNKPSVIHNKLRIVQNSTYHWIGEVHENLFINKGTEERTVYDTNFLVVHHAKDKDWERSHKRNLEILEAMDQTDPRTVYLLGREYYSAQDMRAAEYYMSTFLDMNGTPHESRTAAMTICDIAEEKGDYDKALSYAYEALKRDPAHPSAYLYVCKAHINLGDYSTALNWLQQSLNKKLDLSDGSIQTPQDIERIQHMYLAEIYEYMGEYQKAHDVIEVYVNKANPKADLKVYVDYAMRLKQKALHSKIANAYKIVGNTLIGANPKLLPQVVETIPPTLRHKTEAAQLAQVVGNGREHLFNSVVIYCAHSYEPWDEDSLKKGIGGSETAVIELAKRLGAMGYEVTVYNSVESVKRFGNVTYKPESKINFADKFECFISWRNASVFREAHIDAKKKYLWLHDVPYPQEFKKDVWQKIDKIFVLSKFHRNFLPFIPEEKFFYTNNGVDVDLIKKLEQEGIEREAHAMIYASSYDRGLEHVLDMWPNIIREVPDAKLHICYGWNVFDKRASEADKKWKEQMEVKMQQEGILHHGRVSKKELYRLYLSSAIWVYPTEFPEINCIVAQEAQACGCYPITSGQEAVLERQLGGLYVREEYGNFFALPVGGAWKSAKESKWEAFETGVIEALKEKTLPSVSEEAQKRYDWQATADQWAGELLHGTEVKLPEPLVTVVCTTIRPGPFRMLKDTLDAQTYKNFELIIIDGRYHERHKEVKDYFKDANYKVLHLPDPERDTEKYPYGLCHAFNAALYATNGELQVHIQDFIEIPKNGIEKAVKHYILHPDSFYTGVDNRMLVESKGEPDTIDVFGGEDYIKTKEDYKSVRIWGGKGVRQTWNPMDWELNYGAAPTKRLLELGGWDNDWDRAFGYDNTELSLRHLYAGGELYVDESNKCTAISHWQLFPEDKEGVPHRTKKTNDKRYAAFYRDLVNRKSYNVFYDFVEPIYSNNILKTIQKWKNK